MFLSPGESGGHVEMERHGEQQSIHSSRIEGSKQAAAGQFVPFSQGEGMDSIDTMQPQLRGILRSAVSQLASDDVEFVLLGRSEGMFRSEQAGGSTSVQSGLKALASCGFPVEKRDLGKFVFLKLGEGNLRDDTVYRGFCVEVPSAVRGKR
jgi:hypothetical protein